MSRDFTLSKYNVLCESLVSYRYKPITMQEYIQGQAVEPFVILRHDVDRKPEMALETAGMEYEKGEKANDSAIVFQKISHRDPEAQRT